MSNPSKQSAGGTTLSTALGSETPFHLAMDDHMQPPYNINNSRSNHKKSHYGVDDDSDTFSATSRISLQSTTDGIDVLSGDIDSTNFLVWTKCRAGRVVSSVLFKRSVLALIFITTVLLAVRTLDTLSEESVNVIDKILTVFLWIFTVELLIQAAFYQSNIPYTGWLLADILVLSISWYTRDETCLVLRGFRLLRALRKATGIPSLKWAVKAVLRVLPRLTAVLTVLLPGMFAIFAILFTNLYSDAVDVSRPYFGSLDVAALTLFEIMTGGRQWAEIAAELEEQYPSSWAPLVLFVSVSLFFFGSLIVAIMCDAVSTINRDQVWKSLDHRVHPSHSSRGDDPHFYAPEEPESTDLQRLERKMDELTTTVDSLLRMQATMQETVNLLSRQQLATRQTNVASPTLEGGPEHPV